MSTKPKLIMTSLAVGLAAALSWTLGGAFAYGPFGMGAAVPMLISIGLSAIWAVRFGAVLIQHGKQALWFLAGLPLAVLWPLLVWAYWWPCAAHWRCF